MERTWTIRIDVSGHVLVTPEDVGQMPTKLVRAVDPLVLPPVTYSTDPVTAEPKKVVEVLSEVLRGRR